MTQLGLVAIGKALASGGLQPAGELGGRFPEMWSPVEPVGLLGRVAPSLHRLTPAQTKLTAQACGNG